MNRKMLSSPFSPLRSGFFAVGLIAAAFAQGTESPTVALNLSVPLGVAHSTLVGRLPASTVIPMSISLPPSNPAAMQAYADLVSNPSSTYYHQYLTPVQIGQRFGASGTTVNSVVSYLKARGMTVTLVASNNLTILFKGRADKAETAFATKLYLYHNKDLKDPNAKDFYSYTTAPKLPSSFAKKVQTLGGLQNYWRAQGDSTLVPAQMRALYNVSTLYGSQTGGYKGSGVNVGVTNLDGYLLSNLSLFYSTYNLPFPAGSNSPNVTKVSADGFDGETAEAQGEGDLDIQMVMASAPQCHLYVYDGQGFVAIYTKELEQNVVDIITESYSHPVMDDATRQEAIALHNLHVAMTIQGITYCDSSGDYGTDLTRGQGAPYFYPYPRIEPEITNVGGTVASTDSLGTRITEEGWTGSGAGYTDYEIPFNVRPSWQFGSTVPSGINRRLWPDVALHASGLNLAFADYTNDVADYAYYYFVGGGQTFGSGTSASSPVFAGQLAVMLQNLKTQEAVDPSPIGRFRLGRINDVIYSINGDPSVFFDPTVGDAGPLPNGDEAICKTGWDFVTGWGAPKLDGLTNAFAALSSAVVSDAATSASLYSISNPSLTLGTVAGGDVTSLPRTDGVSYIIQSVKQPGVGQVGAATVTIPLQTSKKRRSALISLSMQNPTKATGYLYLKNASTGAFDLVQTIAGTGSMGTLNLNLDVDQNTYISGSTNGIGGTVTALVRALQPTRLGTTPFNITIDQLSVIERVARN